MIDAGNVLQFMRPDALWEVSGLPQTAEEYAAALYWRSDGVPPTWDEIVAAAPTYEEAVAWEAIRAKRDALLEESDALVLPDRWASYSTETQAALAAYRQALRDIPETFTSPADVVWPEKPVI